MKKFLLLTLLALLIWGSTQLPAAISAYAFGDYYFVLKHHAVDPITKNNLYEDQNGFWLRRIYLTYDSDISDKLKARARLEMNSEGKFSTTAVNISAFVKDAYVSYQYLPLHSLTLGIQEHLSFANIEKFYGYRHVEKTSLDLYKIRDSRDFGLSAKGYFDAAKKFGYAVMFGNNSSYRQETNKQKALNARLTFTPNPNWMFEVYGDMVQVDAVKKDTLLSAFAGYQGDWGRIGLNYLTKTLTETGKADSNYSLIQAFAVAKMGKKFEALVRYDQTFDPQPSGQDSYVIIEKGYKTSLFLAGLGWNIHPRFQIMPNLKIVSYRENKGVKPGSDTYFNVTFYYQF
jgi:hypothetical protein